MPKQILAVLLGGMTLMACEPMQAESLASQKELKDSRLARLSEPVGFSFAKWRDEEVRISLEYTLHKNGKLEIDTFENKETLDDPVGERRKIASRQVMLSQGHAGHVRAMLLRVLPEHFSGDIPINSPLGCTDTLHSSSWFFAGIFSETQQQLRGGVFAAQDSCDGVGAIMARQYLRVFVELLPAEDKPLNYIPAW